MTCCFIVGTGPDLSVHDLRLLGGQYTVGVNYVLDSGFIPDVILWTEDVVGLKQRERLIDCGALLVCPRNLPSAPSRAWRCTLTTGQHWPARAKDNNHLFVDGNTGVCAAHWAACCGFDPVYLVGMGATIDGDKTHFYGDAHPTNRPHEMAALSKELLLLLRNDSFVPVDNIAKTLIHLPAYDADTRRGTWLSAMKNETKTPRRYSNDAAVLSV